VSENERERSPVKQRQESGSVDFGSNDTRSRRVRAQRDREGGGEVEEDSIELRVPGLFSVRQNASGTIEP